MGERTTESTTLAELEREGFSGVGAICRRCGYKASFAFQQFPYRHGLSLARMRQLIECARCSSKIENAQRHHDLAFKPLRPHEKWPS